MGEVGESTNHERRERVGKYSSARDEVLHAMCNEGWGNESSGDIQSPTGYFYRVSNDQSELSEISDAFGTEFQAAGLTDPNVLVGHWLVVERDSGDVEFTEFDSEAELKAEYERLEAEYSQWADEVGDE